MQKDIKTQVGALIVSLLEGRYSRFNYHLRRQGVVMKAIHHLSKVIIMSSLLLVVAAQASVIGPAIHAGETAINAASHPWDWHAGVASTMSGGAYSKSHAYTIVYPYVGYKGDRLTIAGPSGWWRLLGVGDMHISVGGTLLPDSFDPSRSSDPKMKKLNKRKFSIGMGLQGSLLLKSVGLFNVRLLRSFVGGDSGYYADASYTTMFTKGFGGVSLSLIPTAGLQYYSDKLSNYYYGVSKEESNKSGIAAYTASSNFQPYLGVGVMGEVKGRVRAYVSTKMAYLPDSVANSPMISKRYALTTTMVLSIGL
jgi:outer membrane protein